MNAAAAVDNYFNYFTEIEEHFQQRRGSILLLSALDWALIETWKEAGIPLEAVLRGIDAAFERYEKRPSKTRKVNGLAYCAQEVLAAAEEMKEASVGEARPERRDAPGFSSEEVVAFLARNAELMEAATVPEAASAVVRDSAKALRDLAERVETTKTPLEDLERRLTVMEEKIFAVLLGGTADEELVAIRAQADRELAPYRRNMNAAQIDQLIKQFTFKRLLERSGLPRLSLFYL